MANQPTKFKLPKWVSKIPGVGEIIDLALSLWDRASPVIRWCWPIMVALGGALATYWNALPITVKWFSAIVLFYFLAYAIHYLSEGYQRFVAARQSAKFDVSKAKELGEKMLITVSSMGEFLSDRQRTRAEMRRGNNPIDAHSMHDEWQRDRDFEAITGKLFLEKYRSDLMVYLALLNTLGVSTPFHMLHMIGTRPDGTVNFLGLMGGLLAQGYLDQAIDISNDRDFVHKIGI